MVARQLFTALLLSCAACVAAVDIYIPSIFSKTGESEPVIRNDAFCLGAPRPWSGFHNRTGPPEVEVVEGKGPEERQGDLADKFTPLRDNYCLSAPKVFPREVLTPGERALVTCLRAGAAGCNEDPELVRAAARELRGVKMLTGPPPKCFRVLRSGECKEVVGNVETQLKGTFPYSTAPFADWSKGQWPTCALVGRSPIVHVAKNGRIIDSHLSVWRFNLASTAGVSDYVGRRSTLRLVNNADAWRASKGERGPGEREAVSAYYDETWLFWQYNAVGAMSPVQKRLKVPVRLVSPMFIRWQMDAYYALKADLEELGLGPFLCPTAVSSGIHGVLMAAALCQRVHLFGYSYSYAQLISRPGHNNGPQEMYPGHSWRFDAMLLRLLHYAGVASICTEDDPGMPNSLLQARGRPKEGARAKEAAGGDTWGLEEAVRGDTAKRKEKGKEAASKSKAGSSKGGKGRGTPRGRTLLAEADEGGL